MPNRRKKTLKVVVNHEEQYRVVPEDRETPVGWRDVDKRGSREELLGWLKDLFAASGGRPSYAERLEDLLDEEDRTSSDAGEHIPR